MQFVGRNGSDVLLTSDNVSVIVNEDTNEVSPVDNIASVLASVSWNEHGEEPSTTSYEIATGYAVDLDIKVFADSDRMYTIPKSVQSEAKRALEWRKEEGRGGTPVGLNTARTLAKGGQIGIRKVRHIAKYFPRHEVDKRGKGYKPAEDGYPSNGRIAWALWGGDSAKSWASAIVERENKKAVTASIYKKVDNIDVSYFSNSTNVDFAIRVQGNGSGIDRLYAVHQDNSVEVWDNGSWFNLGETCKSFQDIDSVLDFDVDGKFFYHFPVDQEAALVASALLDSSPFLATGIQNIDITETEMVLAASADIDWGYIDSLTFAEASDADGNYTSDERAENVESQVRDASGKFAKMGGRVTVANNPQATGTIRAVSGGTATIEFDNGNTADVAVSDTRPAEQAPAAVPPPRYGQPLDVSGILGEPRQSTNPKLAGLPNRLPPLTADSMQIMLNDWGSWVSDQRASYEANRQEIPKVKVNTQADDELAPNAYNDPYLRRWLDTVYGKGSNKTYPNRSWYNPVRTDDIESQESAKSVGYRGPSRSGGSGSGSGKWTKNVSMKNGIVTTTKNYTSVYESITAAADLTALTPENSDIPAIYMAIVAQDDPQAVMNLVALIPADNKSTTPTLFKRHEGKWVKDEAILTDLNSPTPPPVVVLDDETLSDVMVQMEKNGMEKQEELQKQEEINSQLSVLWGPTGDLLAIIAAGGADRNRGNAETLRRYWTVGEGGAKIRWGTGGDWTRCVRQLSKYMGPRAKGYCALRHKEMTGLWTGDKAHRQMYGRKGAFNTYSDDYIRSSAEIISNAELSAQAEEIKNRVLVASGGFQAPATSGAEFFIPVVLPEGAESGDGRSFSIGAVTMRQLPLPLMWQIKTAQGHDGSVVVGRIDKMERTADGVGNAYGVFDSGEYGREAERLVRGGFIRGISADLDRFEADAEEETSSEENKKMGTGKIKITKGRIMGVTLVPKPAFQECRILLTDEIVDVQEEPVSSIGMQVKKPVSSESALVACAAVVASIPMTPPKSWFENPKLTGPTPLTVTDDGRVFGHIAAWHVDHIGLSFGTKPPRSKSGYSYFHTGVCRTEEGADVPVGQLTLAGGHAPLEASAKSAAKHYDDTASAFADVHAGEDSFGIWVSGSLRPEVTPHQVRAIRASAPSGDWRPIQGALELVAVCQVNVPGFPIARARVASGEVMALVAAGANYLARLKDDPELLNQYAEIAKSRFASLKEEFINESGITAGGAGDIEPLYLSSLHSLMADVVNLYFRAHGYHWNVVGADFAQYHELFQEIYEDVYSSIDPMGENIRKLGGFPKISIADYAHMSSLSGSELSGGSPRALAADLLLANEVVIDELKAMFQMLEAANEQGVADFIAGRIDMHQKWQWQLSSSLSEVELLMTENEPVEINFETVFSALEEQGLVAAGPSEAIREKLAESGEALPNGSYPIRNVSDLRKAVRAYGRSKPSDRAKVRRHITKRAKALGKPDLVPDEWKNLSASRMELSISLADMRSKISTNSLTAAADIMQADATVEATGGVDPKVPASNEAPQSEGKYTAQTQPRDARGKFRLVLARLKKDSGVASLDALSKRIGEVENLDNVGNYARAAQGARDVIDTVNRIDTGALDSTALTNVRTGATALAETISNLPLPFENQSQKIRFSDVPSALADLMKDMIQKVEAKIGKEDAGEVTKDLKSFMAGGDVYSQSEISSKMNRLLRLLT
jgi:DNA-binding ferritin-like protein